MALLDVVQVATPVATTTTSASVSLTGTTAGHLLIGLGHNNQPVGALSGNPVDTEWT